MRKARSSKEEGPPCALSSSYRSTPLISDSGSLAWFEGLYFLRYCDWEAIMYFAHPDSPCRAMH